jgi:hypothetical protein
MCDEVDPRYWSGMTHMCTPPGGAVSYAGPSAHLISPHCTHGDNPMFTIASNMIILGHLPGCAIEPTGIAVTKEQRDAVLFQISMALILNLDVKYEA